MTWWFVGSSCSNCGRLWWPFSWTRRTEPPNPQCNLFRSIILATHHLFHVLLQRSMPCEVLQKWKLAPASHVVCNVLSPRRIVCIVFSIHIYTRLHVYIVYRHIYMYICTSYFFSDVSHLHIFPYSRHLRAMRWAVALQLIVIKQMAPGKSRRGAVKMMDLFNPGVKRLHILGSNKANLRSFWVICP